MRLRTLLVLGLAAATGAVGGALVAARLFGTPDAGLEPPPEVVSGLTFQRTLAELAMRAAGVSPGVEPLVVTTAQLNAFLARHVESRHLSLRPVRVRAEAGRLEVAGRIGLGRLAGRSALGRLLTRAPAGVGETEIWVSARGPLRVSPGEAELVVEATRVGRQAVPADWVWRALELDPREELRWRLPRVVESIEVQPGRLLIHTRRRGR